MPIQSALRNGQRWYRWGDTGKWFPTRKQAEEQAAAAYASGYKSKEGKNDKK